MLKVPSLTLEPLGDGAVVLQALPTSMPKSPAGPPNVRGKLHSLVRNARNPCQLVMSCR